MPDEVVTDLVKEEDSSNSDAQAVIARDYRLSIWVGRIFLFNQISNNFIWHFILNCLFFGFLSRRHLFCCFRSFIFRVIAFDYRRFIFGPLQGSEDKAAVVESDDPKNETAETTEQMSSAEESEEETV